MDVPCGCGKGQRPFQGGCQIIFWGYDQGYNHSFNAIYVTDNGTYVHAECGGCSCGGSGSVTEGLSLKEALRLFPEYHSNWGTGEEYFIDPKFAVEIYGTIRKFLGRVPDWVTEACKKLINHE